MSQNILLTETESETNEEVVITIKKSRGRPMNPDRHLSEKYNGKPLDPEYYKKYYISKLKQNVCCSICGKCTNIAHIRRHERSAFCLKVKYQLENKNI